MPVTPGQAWSSNCTPAELAGWLGSKRDIVLLTHSKPDGDALGATLALARVLNARAERPVATCWYWGPMLPWMRPFVGDTPARRLDEAPLPEQPDAVVIADTGTWIQLSEAEPWIRDRRAITAVVDHHLQGDADVGDRMLIEPAAAAVCEPVAEVCRLLLGVERYSDLPRPVAEALYVGVGSDTGWFRFSNVRPQTLRLAAQLIEAGADKSRLYETVEQQHRPARLLLLSRALASLELHDAGRIALLTLRRSDFDASGAVAGESTGFGEIPLSIGSVRVSGVLVESGGSDGTGPGRHLTKVSLRSKAGDGAVDVNLVAQKLGGGGHARAAGAKLPCDLVRAKELVLRAIR